MKRDMDLIREILIEMEKWPADARPEIKIAGRSPEEITHHLGLMADAGLIHAVNASSHDGEDWIPIKINWEGYEFLDAARSDTLWNKAKETVITKTGTLTLEAVKVALGMLMKQALIGGL